MSSETTTTQPSSIPEVTWETKHWQDLNGPDVYYILKLRMDVFVVEQNAVYYDIDDKDKKAVHLMGWVNHPDTNERELVAYSRVFKKGSYFANNSCIGRVVVATKWRRYGFGQVLVEKALELLILNRFTFPVLISGQLYLKKFYQSHGFVQVPGTDEYLEDGIPHIEMLLEEVNLAGNNKQYIGQCVYDTESQQDCPGQDVLTLL